MTRLYILIIFDIKKITRSIWNSSAHLGKGKEPISYMVVRKKYVIHPKNFETSKTFWRAMLAHLQGISPSAGGIPHKFKKKMFLAKNACTFFLYIGASICIGRETLFLPYAGFLLFLIWDGSWSYLIVIFQMAK